MQNPKYTQWMVLCYPVISLPHHVIISMQTAKYTMRSQRMVLYNQPLRPGPHRVTISTHSPQAHANPRTGGTQLNKNHKVGVTETDRQTDTEMCVCVCVCVCNSCRCPHEICCGLLSLHVKSAVVLFDVQLHQCHSCRSTYVCDLLCTSFVPFTICGGSICKMTYAFVLLLLLLLLQPHMHSSVCRSVFSTVHTAVTMTDVGTWLLLWIAMSSTTP